jgi:hypothetical protein
MCYIFTMIKDANRGKKILQSLNVKHLPFKLDSSNLREFGKHVSKDLTKIFLGIESSSLKWCLSTVKKAKVFTLIYEANENGVQIYKEEISKKLPEYSYKTIATIIDEGIAKGYYLPMAPMSKKVMKDKKIKNIRPSEDVVAAFLNWNITRISSVSEMIKKFK